MESFEFDLDDAAFRDWLGLPRPRSFVMPHVEIGDMALVVRSDAREPDVFTALSLEPMRARFGLVPAAFASIAGADHERYHNVRLERMHYLRNTVRLLDHHRCVIPVTAYHQTGSDGVVRRFRLAGGAPFLLAGLWDVNSRPCVSGDCRTPLVSFAVITQPVDTTNPEPSASRLPIALDFEAGCEWLRVLQRMPRGPWKIRGAFPQSAFEVASASTVYRYGLDSLFSARQ